MIVRRSRNLRIARGPALSRQEHLEAGQQRSQELLDTRLKELQAVTDEAAKNAVASQLANHADHVEGQMAHIMGHLEAQQQRSQELFDTRFRELQARMDEHAKQFSNRVGNIDGQMSRLVGCLEVQQQQSQDLLETFRELQAMQVERLFANLRKKGHVEEQQSQELFDTRFRELQARMDEHAKQFSKRIEIVDSQMSSLVGRLEAQQQTQELWDTRLKELQAFTDEAVKNAVASQLTNCMDRIDGQMAHMLGHLEEQQQHSQELWDTRVRELQAIAEEAAHTVAASQLTEHVGSIDRHLVAQASEGSAVREEPGQSGQAASGVEPASTSLPTLLTHGPQEPQESSRRRPSRVLQHCRGLFCAVSTEAQSLWHSGVQSFGLSQEAKSLLRESSRQVEAEAAQSAVLAQASLCPEREMGRDCGVASRCHQSR
ncbi:unnamed protein product [Symbiodinium sp. KB8]|nr:unnamed protein product [Symbiodinium sp. KB8]